MPIQSGSTDQYGHVFCSDRLQFLFGAPLSCGFLVHKSAQQRSSVGSTLNTFARFSNTQTPTLEHRYASLEESKANGEKSRCGENWSLEEKTDSGCAFDFCQMDEFPMVDPTYVDDDGNKNDTVFINSVELWVRSVVF